MKDLDRIKKLPGVREAVLVEKTGIPAYGKEVALSAMTASLWALGGYFTARFQDELRCVEINGSSMSIFAFPYGENVLLVVAADGKVKDEISELVECL
jgi:predicted regulator of Ras-like GTPase activity (Roadblock/LC7/MglB family)